MSVLFIILVGLTMTWYSEKMPIFNRCIGGLMPNLIKKSWTVSSRATHLLVTKRHWTKSKFKGATSESIFYFLILPILFLHYEESLVSSNLNSKLFIFHCVRPNLHCNVVKGVNLVNYTNYLCKSLSTKNIQHILPCHLWDLVSVLLNVSDHS